ncbi:hypothetical protein MMC07_003783 [Pseudocyphellaria aurata]|nr:hypothetical protein [Pseudocyphellaria aurata]
MASESSYPTIDDDYLRNRNRDLCRHRARWDREEADRTAKHDLIEIGEFFSKYVDSLATQLDIEKRHRAHLAKKVKALEKDNERLENECDSQKNELAALEDKLAKGKEQRRSYGTEYGSKRVDLRNTETSRNSSAHERGSNEFMRPPKRGAEIDMMTNEKTSKKGKT